MFTLNLFFGWLYSLQKWNREGGSLASAIFCASQYVSACQRNRDALFLNRRGLLEAFLVYTRQQLALKQVVLELVALCCGDILEQQKSGTNPSCLLRKV